MMTVIRAIAAACVAAVAGVVFGQANPTDANKSVPRFEDFPVSASAIFNGTPADPQFQNPGRRMYRTMIRQATKKRPNFAGRYRIAEWGCGTACVQIAIVDTKSGQVYRTLEVFPGTPLSGSGALGDEGETGMFYRLDSLLFILRGCPNFRKCAAYYYKWNGNQFTLLRRVPMKPLYGSEEYQFSPITDVECAPDGNVKIVHGDGTEFQAPKESGQISCSSPAVAESKWAAGWLVAYENCCTSYPIPTTLVIYKVGEPFRRFGDGKLIADWHFLEDGTQVVFYSNTVHGDRAPHYELRDTETGHLIDQWDGHVDERAPAWTQRMRQ